MPIKVNLMKISGRKIWKAGFLKRYGAKLWHHWWPSTIALKRARRFILYRRAASLATKDLTEKLSDAKISQSDNISAVRCHSGTADPSLGSEKHEQFIGDTRSGVPANYYFCIFAWWLLGIFVIEYHWHVVKSDPSSLVYVPLLELECQARKQCPLIVKVLVTMLPRPERALQ